MLTYGPPGIYVYIYYTQHTRKKQVEEERYIDGKMKLRRKKIVCRGKSIYKKRTVQKTKVDTIHPLNI